METTNVKGQGWIAFASIVMILGGIFQAIEGLIAIFNDQWFATINGNLLLFDLTAWGWTNLLIGLVVVMAGSALMIGKMWARVLAILIASLAAVANLVSINIYPIWSIIGITISVLVIHAVAVHGGELKTR